MRYSRGGAGRRRIRLLSALRARVQARTRARNAAKAIDDAKAGDPDLDKVQSQEAQRLLLYGMSIPCAIFVGVVLAAFLSSAGLSAGIVIGVALVALLTLWAMGHADENE